MTAREEFEAWARKHDAQAHVLRFVHNKPLTEALPESWRIYEAAYAAGRKAGLEEAVEDYGKTFGRPLDMAWIMRRADELLRGEK